MKEQDKGSASHRTGTLRDLLQHGGCVLETTTLAEFISCVGETSDQWQRDDWSAKEKDDDYLLNNARLVSQVWFRGHRTNDLSLQPGLYRESTWLTLAKGVSSPKPEQDDERCLFEELFDLEHELRIDFISYGHLLNDVNQAKNAIDWYFLMQHHGIPTRLLDWTTNALTALFFSLESAEMARGTRTECSRSASGQRRCSLDDRCLLARHAA
jgi:hypothetical protein